MFTKPLVLALLFFPLYGANAEAESSLPPNTTKAAGEEWVDIQDDCYLHLWTDEAGSRKEELKCFPHKSPAKHYYIDGRSTPEEKLQKQIDELREENKKNKFEFRAEHDGIKIYRNDVTKQELRIDEKTGKTKIVPWP